MQTDETGAGELGKDHERMAHPADHAGERPVSGAAEALSNAIARFGRPKALVFHSDRGCQY